MYRYIDLLLSILIQQYLPSPKCLILISGCSNTTLKVPLGTLVINGQISQQSQVIFHNFGCQNFVLNVDKPSEAFSAIEKELLRHTETFNSRKFIVFTLVKENALEIFKTQSVKFVSDILLIRLDEIIIKTKPNSLLNDNHIIVSFWTHKYTGINNNDEPYLMDKWFSNNQSFMLGTKLFYDKLRNQQGRKIKVGCFTNIPYVRANENSTCISGFEINLLRTIAQYINASLEFLIDEGLWGYASLNKSSGIKGHLFNDNIDVGAAGFYMNKLVMQQFGLTLPYFTEGITCLVPAPSLTAPWLSPYKSFSKDTWVFLILTYFLLGVAIYLITYCDTYVYKNNSERSDKTSKILLIQKSFTAVIKPLIFQPLAKKDYYYKPLFSVIIMANFVIFIAYNAGFASVMVKPIYENSIDSLEEFLNSDISWGTMLKAEWIVAWENDTEEKYRKAARRYVSATPEELRKLSKQGNFAFKMARIIGQPYVGPYIKEDVLKKYRVMKEDIHTQNTVLILRKHSILLPTFNKLIDKLLQTGMINFWAREYGGHEVYVIQRELKGSKLGINREHVILELKHVIGAFYLLIGGTFLGLLSFCIEMLLNKKY